MQKNNYRHSRDVLRHSAVYKKRRKAKVVKTYIISFVFIVLLVAFILLFRLPFLSISEIQVKGLQSASTQAVINEINSSIHGNYALIIPKKNIFFYPKDEIKTELLNKFSTFKNVEVETVDANKLEISVTERNAGLIICKNSQSIEDRTFTDCFFADSNSVAFQSVSGEPDKSLIRFVDESVKFGSSTLSNSTIEKMYVVLSKLSVAGFGVDYIKSIDKSSLEIYIIDNGKLILPVPIDDKVMSILDTTLKTRPLSTKEKFEYVDMRFGNKIFFKSGEVNGNLKENASSSKIIQNSKGPSASTSTSTISRMSKTIKDKNTVEKKTSTRKTLVVPNANSKNKQNEKHQ